MSYSNPTGLRRGLPRALRGSAAATALALAGLAFQPVYAQSAPGGTEADEYGLRDIVVTAGKREQRLSEVPGGITAVSGDVLEARSASSLEDYLALIPGITIQSYGTPGWGSIQIRGVASQGVTTTTATYIDEVPVGPTGATARSTQYTSDLDPADLERVEVLKGPQGTLYGASSMGGVIKYITRKPSLTNSEIRLGIDGHVVEDGDIGSKMRASISTPLVEGLAGLRVSGYYRKDAGYVDNLALGMRDVNGGDAWGVRAALYIEPSENLSISLSGMYQHSKTDGFNIVDLDPVTLEPIDRDLAQRRYVPESFTVSNLLVAAEIKWDIGVGTLLSATGYSESKPNERQDLSTTPGFGFSPAAPGIYDGLHATDKVTQEIRFNSKRIGPVEFIAGGFYTHERLNDDTGFYAANRQGGIDTTQPAVGVNRRFGTLQEYAGFANATLYLSERFDITAGYRHAKIDQDQSAQRNGPIYGAPVNTNVKFSESADTYLAGARFRPNSDLMFYLRAASGYRPGASRNIPPTAPPTLSNFYTSDSLWSYEGGVKAKALDGRLSFDVSGFWVDWSNIQTLLAFGRFTTGGNAGSAVSKGFELQAAFEPVNGLTFGGNTAYTDAHFTEDNAATGVQDGDRLTLVPKWTASAFTEYNFPLTADIDAKIGADVAYSSSKLDVSRFSMAGYTLYGLNAGIQKGDFSANIYVKNLTNKRAIVGSFGNRPPDDYQATINQPRTIGVSLSQRF